MNAKNRPSDPGKPRAENPTQPAAFAREPKVSVIVPVYGVARPLVDKCLDSILAQTYRNIELVIVNDGSPTDVRAIGSRYMAKDSRVKFVDLKQNGGLFHARIAGAEAATGEYLAFVDADDTISLDYIRLLATTACAHDSDIVLATTVIEPERGHAYIQNLAVELPFDHLADDAVFAEFMRQRGYNYIWHTVGSRLFSRRVWNVATKYTAKIRDHIVTTEDILHSFAIWSNARRVDRAVTAEYYYFRRADSSTMKRGNLKHAAKCVGDVVKVFARAEEILRAEGKLAKYRADFYGWRDYYAAIWRRTLDEDGFRIEPAAAPLYASLDRLARHRKYHDLKSEFHKIATETSPGLEKIKRQIADPRVEIVSFDMFDTLVVRPFANPTDLFWLMERDFRELVPGAGLLEFKDMRQLSEEIARDETDREDVTIEEIYGVMARKFAVPRKALTELENREIVYELRFLHERKIARELFDLAKYLGKKVIVTTDMYLPRAAIEQILARNGYGDYDELFLSSDLGKSKGAGGLYDHVAHALGAEPAAILHIGDNADIDVRAAKEHGFRAALLPKTTDALYGVNGVGADIFGRIFDREWSLARNSFGIRMALALAANKYFDNPFRPFQRDSTFNCSPEFMGYFALGLEMFVVSRWILRESKDADSLVFLARDGFLPQKIVAKLAKHSGKPAPRMHYFRTSRKAMILLAAPNAHRVADLQTFSGDYRVKESVLAALGTALRDGVDADKFAHKIARDRAHPLLADHLAEIAAAIDFKKVEALRAKFRSTFAEEFAGKVAVFDIGYSGKPEQMFTEIFAKNVKTLFMYRNFDEPYRRLGAENVRVFSHFDVVGARELAVSELGPSCVGYREQGGRLVPQFEGYRAGYYRWFVISRMQSAAAEFADDMCATFSAMELDAMRFDHDPRMFSAPLDTLMDRPSWVDAQIFRGIFHEDDVGPGNGDVYDTFYAPMFPEPDPLARLYSMNRLARVKYYLLHDRATMKDKVWKYSPLAFRLAKYPWDGARAVRRAVRRAREK